MTREVTEDPKRSIAGTVVLVGTDVARIVGEVEEILRDSTRYMKMALAHNPYGDGHAAGRIVNVLSD